MKLRFRLTVVALLVSFLGASSGLSATSRKDVGLGVVLGEPTGLTGKFWTGSTHAVDVGLAFSLDDYMLIYADYLFHFPKALGSSTPFLRQLTPYVGVGGEFIFSNNSRRLTRYFDSEDYSFGLGLRIPLGLEWVPSGVPLGFFVELVPGVGILPGTFGFVQGGLGVRYYF